MARPRTVSDAEILAAAREVFLSQGASASTSIIARRIGVSQAALFKRFGTKQDLMMAALRPPAEPPWVPAVHAGPDVSRPIEPQLRELSLEMLRFLVGMVPAMMVLSTCGIQPKVLLEEHEIPPPIIAQRAVAAWLARGMDAGLVRRAEPAHLALTWMGALHVRAFFSSLTGLPLTEADIASHVDAVVDSLWLGLAPAPIEASP